MSKAAQINSYLYSFEHNNVMEHWEISLAKFAPGIFMGKAKEKRFNLAINWGAINFEDEQDAVQCMIKKIEEEIKP